MYPLWSLIVFSSSAFSSARRWCVRWFNRRRLVFGTWHLRKESSFNLTTLHTSSEGTSTVCIVSDASSLLLLSYCVRAPSKGVIVGGVCVWRCDAWFRLQHGANLLTNGLLMKLSWSTVEHFLCEAWFCWLIKISSVILVLRWLVGDGVLWFHGIMKGCLLAFRVWDIWHFYVFVYVELLISICLFLGGWSENGCGLLHWQLVELRLSLPLSPQTADISHEQVMPSDDWIGPTIRH